LAPRDAAAYLERGIVRGAQGDFDGAIADFGKVLELNPESAKAYANRGVILLMQGQETAAQDDFERAFKLDSRLRPQIQKVIDEILKTRKPKP
jgi:Flp pilus assembly protein TadD